MSSILLTILIASLVLIYLSLPYLKNNLTDVDILALLNQSSISHTRKLGETAIYRSIDVPHGLPLSTGLRIRSGYNLRDGNLKDIWYNCIIDLKESTNSNNNNKRINFIKDKDSINLLKLNKLCHSLENSINNSTNFKKFTLISPLNSINSIIVLFTSLFMNSNFTLNYIPSNEFNLNNLSLNDSDLIFTISENIPILLRHLESLNKIIVLDEISDKFLKNSNKIIKFSDFVNSIDDDASDNDLKYDYNPNDIKIENNPLIISTNKSITKFYQRNFVSAISSQLMSLPKDHNWNSSDNLLISINDQEITENKENNIEPEISNFIIKLLSGLLSNINEITISLDSELHFNKLIEYNINILSMNSFNFKKLIKNKLILNNLPKLSKISKNLITNEIFNNFGKLSEFKSLNLRLIYLSINNNLNYNFQNSINSNELITILSILNTRIIIEKLNKFCIGAIFKTNLFDYRLHKSDLKLLNSPSSSSSSTLFYRKLGIASNCIESKLKDCNLNGVELLAENKSGKLFIRGFNIGKSDLNINTFKRTEAQGKSGEAAGEDEGWMPTEIYGKFGNDGCFYEYAISE